MLAQVDVCLSAPRDDADVLISDILAVRTARLGFAAQPVGPKEVTNSHPRHSRTRRQRSAWGASVGVGRGRARSQKLLSFGPAVRSLPRLTGVKPSGSLAGLWLIAGFPQPQFSPSVPRISLHEPALFCAKLHKTTGVEIGETICA